MSTARLCGLFTASHGSLHHCSSLQNPHVEGDVTGSSCCGDWQQDPFQSQWFQKKRKKKDQEVVMPLSCTHTHSQMHARRYTHMHTHGCSQCLQGWRCPLTFVVVAFLSHFSICLPGVFSESLATLCSSGKCILSLAETLSSILSGSLWTVNRKQALAEGTGFGDWLTGRGSATTCMLHPGPRRRSTGESTSTWAR